MKKYNEKDSFAVTLGKKIGLSLLDIAGASEKEKQEYLERVDKKMAENKAKKEECEKTESTAEDLRKFLICVSAGKEAKKCAEEKGAKIESLHITDKSGEIYLKIEMIETEEGEKYHIVKQLDKEDWTISQEADKTLGIQTSNPVHFEDK